MSSAVQFALISGAMVAMGGALEAGPLSGFCLWGCTCYCLGVFVGRELEVPA